MLSRDRVSLNALAFESTCALIEGVLARGVNLAEAYIDALGDTTKHKARRGGAGLYGLQFGKDAGRFTDYSCVTLAAAAAAAAAAGPPVAALPQRPVCRGGQG